MCVTKENDTGGLSMLLLATAVAKRVCNRLLLMLQGTCENVRTHTNLIPTHAPSHRGGGLADKADNLNRPRHALVA